MATTPLSEMADTIDTLASEEKKTELFMAGFLKEVANDPAATAMPHRTSSDDER